KLYSSFANTTLTKSAVALAGIVAIAGVFASVIFSNLQTQKEIAGQQENNRIVYTSPSLPSGIASAPSAQFTSATSSASSTSAVTHSADESPRYTSAPTTIINQVLGLTQQQV